MRQEGSSQHDQKLIFHLSFDIFHWSFFDAQFPFTGKMKESRIALERNGR